jgi:hypothetical protein
MKLTGKYYLRRRIFGGYNVYVEYTDRTGAISNYWSKAEHWEVAEVIGKTL